MRIGNQHLVCTPDRWDGINMNNGHGEVRCDYHYTFQRMASAFQTPLIIEIAYGYSEVNRQLMTIKKAS